MPHFTPLTGATFGRWTVVGPHKVINKNTHWWCRCSCGLESFVASGALQNGRSQGCRKCAGKRRGLAVAVAHGFVDGKPRLMQTRWSKLLAGAKKRGREVAITKNEALHLLIEQECRCAVTGWPINLPGFTTGPTSVGATASLDRIDNSRGYITDNVRWTHWTINKMKGTLSDEEFIDACTAVVEGVTMNAIWPYIDRAAKEEIVRAYMNANAPKNLPEGQDWQPLAGVKFFRTSKLMVK